MREIQPITIWFTGLSASGKSTLSERLYNDLQKLGIKNVELLDGEMVRDMFKNYNFDDSSREQVGIQKAKIALELNQQGKIVLVSGIAHKRKWRHDIRKMMDRYFEVYLDCGVNECSKRDYKGHYQKALSGELVDFVGVSEPYEESDECDLVLHTGRDAVEVCSRVLLEKIKEVLKV